MKTLPVLSLLETRVLGVLVEKEKTVPDTYPLSLNALTNGCNQKNNRDPVLDAKEADVQAAIDRLMSLSLISESSGTRVARYAHKFGRELGLPAQSVALLAVLMLRGPQTAGELRINSDRLHHFADISSVEAFLEELAARPQAQGGPFVMLLARRPGEREQRWAHLLSGPVADEPRTEPRRAAVDHGTTSTAPGDADMAALWVEVERLATEVAQLRAVVETLQQAAVQREQDRSPAAS